MAEEVKHPLPHPAPHTIKMARKSPAFPNGPLTADVPAAEVKNFEAGGWHIEKESK